MFRLIAGLVVAFLARRSRLLRPWHVETLRPKSVAELLALYNPDNARHVKVVGYNNGVVHFGQRHPGNMSIDELEKIIKPMLGA